MEANNRLIAEFMGVYSHSDGWNYDEIGNKGVQYHISWDWLMPVVEKIEELGFEFFIVENRSKVCHNTDKSIDVLFYLEGYNKLDTTYQAVVQFIEWYNSQS